MNIKMMMMIMEMTITETTTIETTTIVATATINVTKITNNKGQLTSTLIIAGSGSEK